MLLEFVVAVCLLFNDGHVLQIWSETVAVYRRKIYGLNDRWWPYGNRERKWPKFPAICFAVEGKPREKLQTEN